MPADDAPRPGEEELAEAAAAEEARGGRRGGDRRARRRPRPRRRPTAAAQAEAEARRGRAPPRRPPPRADAEPAAAEAADRAEEAAADEAATSSRRRAGRPAEASVLRLSRSARRRSRARGGSLIELVTIVAVALGLALGIQAFLVKPFRIPSESMVPDARRSASACSSTGSASTSATTTAATSLVFKPPPGADTTHVRGPARRDDRPARRRPRSARTRTSSSGSWPSAATGSRCSAGTSTSTESARRSPFAHAPARLVRHLQPARRDHGSARATTS